jgi:hypothetical protein
MWGIGYNVLKDASCQIMRNFVVYVVRGTCNKEVQSLNEPDVACWHNCRGYIIIIIISIVFHFIGIRWRVILKCIWCKLGLGSVLDLSI